MPSSQGPAAEKIKSELYGIPFSVPTGPHDAAGDPGASTAWSRDVSSVDVPSAHRKSSAQKFRASGRALGKIGLLFRRHNGSQRVVHQAPAKSELCLAEDRLQAWLAADSVSSQARAAFDAVVADPALLRLREEVMLKLSTSDASREDASKGLDLLCRAAVMETCVRSDSQQVETMSLAEDVARLEGTKAELDSNLRAVQSSLAARTMELSEQMKKSAHLDSDLTALRRSVAEAHEQCERVNAFKQTALHIAEGTIRVRQMSTQVIEALNSSSLIKGLSRLPREYTDSEEGRNLVKNIQKALATGAKMQKELDSIDFEAKTLWKSAQPSAASGMRRRKSRSETVG